LRCLVVYPHLPHYRHGVFTKLQASRQINFEFAADNACPKNTVALMPEGELRKFHKLTNHWFGPFLWQSGLFRLIIRNNFDSVLFLGDYGYLSTWVAAILCRLLRLRTFFWTIGWHRPDEGVKKIARMTYYRLAHRLLLYGNIGKSIGTKAGFPEARIWVIGNSYSSHAESGKIATRDRMAELEKLLPSPGREVLTAVVRLNPQKRLDLLIEAAALLRRSGRDLCVVLVGAGPELGKLRQLAKELEVDVRLPGACYSKEELSLVYDRTTITVVPRAVGLTAIQSLEFGRSVVTTANAYEQGPEFESMKPGATAALFQDFSAPALASTIEKELERVQRHGPIIAELCQHEILSHWSVEAHARSIERALMQDFEGRRGESWREP
jgi:glycosyltransferase involved in cell wall biosynthesis